MLVTKWINPKCITVVQWVSWVYFPPLYPDFDPNRDWYFLNIVRKQIHDTEKFKTIGKIFTSMISKGRG